MSNPWLPGAILGMAVAFVALRYLSFNIEWIIALAVVGIVAWVAFAW